MNTEKEIKKIKDIAIKNGWYEGNNGLFTKFPIDRFLSKEEYRKYLKLTEALKG